MEAQYQLVDVETKKAINVGKEFEIIDLMRFDFDNPEPISWDEAAILFGDPFSVPVLGILGTSPIAAARKSLAREGEITGTGRKQPMGIIHYGGNR